MDYELKKILLILTGTLLILIGTLLIGGLTVLFNIIYATIFLTILVAYIAVTFFCKDLLISIARFISCFIFPKR